MVLLNVIGTLVKLLAKLYIAQALLCNYAMHASNHSIRFCFRINYGYGFVEELVDYQKILVISHICEGKKSGI